MAVTRKPINKPPRATEDEKRYLQNQLSRYDKITTDYLHLFEMGRGNFPNDITLKLHEGFADMLHERRTCKNRLHILYGADTKASEKYIYKPRILTDMFMRYREFLNVR